MRNFMKWTFRHLHNSLSVILITLHCQVLRIIKLFLTFIAVANVWDRSFVSLSPGSGVSLSVLVSVSVQVGQPSFDFGRNWNNWFWSTSKASVWTPKVLSMHGLSVMCSAWIKSRSHGNTMLSPYEILIGYLICKSVQCSTMPHVDCW